MAKFRVMIVKKNGKPVGVRAAQINGRVIYLALQDEQKQMNWYDTVKVGIPTKEELIAISENFDAINRAFVRAGKKPLKKAGIGLPRSTATSGRGLRTLITAICTSAVRTTLTFMFFRCSLCDLSIQPFRR